MIYDFYRAHRLHSSFFRPKKISDAHKQMVSEQKQKMKKRRRFYYCYLTIVIHLCYFTIIIHHYYNYYYRCRLCVESMSSLCRVNVECCRKTLIIGAGNE